MSEDSVSETPRPVVIGAGAAGLIACLELEQAGQSPILLEASDRVGGRLRTELDEDTGFPLDHGFQVLLTAYPAAQRYLDLAALDLRVFDAGAMIRKGGRWRTVGDPRRKLSDALPTVLSGIGTMGDRLRVLRLSFELARTPVESCFEGAPQTTFEYLRERGFSEGFIEDFFRPFYSGIFLEPELRTSARMFRFVFKMFAAGDVAVPGKGMQAIAEQLRGRLESTELRLGARVRGFDSAEVRLESGETLAHAGCIVATPTLPGAEVDAAPRESWNSCWNAIFPIAASPFSRPIIGLLPGDGIVTNLHVMGDLFGPSKGEQDRLSVTAVTPSDRAEDEVVAQIRAELESKAGLRVPDPQRVFRIPRALPVCKEPTYAPGSAPELRPGVFRAGDAQANPSLNAAMLSGTVAAKALLESLTPA